ncbi:hypothetical protein ATZ99_15790 [Thermovenabulum gondwanense]|uniref:Uncharacterized protein n=1 Tax=Thermovenabulum gondwanense TaxID=520767 RepID=A0A162MEA5_9FIRM|nr:hypothetical protein ATZ99_15790 [Thermovenabulum gondwanense]
MYIKRILCEVAWCITRIRDSYLAKWYWKIKQRRGGKKAIVALARKLLVIIYNMIKNNTDYNENVFKEVREKQEANHIKRIINEIRKHGYEVISPQSEK